MSTSWLAGTGTVVARIDAPTASVVLVSVHDDSGRLVQRRRVHDLRVALTLPTGRLLITVTDDRTSHDPRRHAGSSTVVEVVEHTVVEQTLTLTRGGVVRATTARHARVTAVHDDGERIESRADGLGHVVLGGLREGSWTLVARDVRRSLTSRPTLVTTTAATTCVVELDAATPTSRLLVQVGGTDPRPVTAREVVVTDTTGRRVTAPLRGGLADLRGLLPGPHTLTVPASIGHLGAEVGLEALEPDTLSAVTVRVRVGASITGRVVQGARSDDLLYAAVVTLVDDDGRELERVRTGEDGRFVLGTGLPGQGGLTVVATTGPETLHVTRAAVADLSVVTGVCHDLGDIALPMAGRRAVWRARTPAVAGMKLPSTRV